MGRTRCIMTLAMMHALQALQRFMRHDQYASVSYISHVNARFPIGWVAMFWITMKTCEWCITTCCTAVWVSLTGGASNLLFSPLLQRHKPTDAARHPFAKPKHGRYTPLSPYVAQFSLKAFFTAWLMLLGQPPNIAGC